METIDRWCVTATSEYIDDQGHWVEYNEHEYLVNKLLEEISDLQDEVNYLRNRYT